MLSTRGLRPAERTTDVLRTADCPAVTMVTADAAGHRTAGVCSEHQQQTAASPALVHHSPSAADELHPSSVGSIYEVRCASPDGTSVSAVDHLASAQAIW